MMEEEKGVECGSVQTLFLKVSYSKNIHHFNLLKGDKYRRKDKGRRCSLGDRIYSIPCVSCFALGRVEE